MVFRGAGASDLAILTCRHMCIEHVTVVGGTGYCFGETGGQGGNKYIDDYIVYPPKPRSATSLPILAACADGLHSNSIRHGPTVVGCHFEGTGDDSLAIQGWYAILRRAAGRQWVVEFPRNVGSDFCKAGDLLRIDDSHGGFLGSTRVVRKKRLRRYKPQHPTRPEGVIGKALPGVFYAVTVSHPVAHIALDDRVNDTNVDGAGFVVRNCVIQHGCSRGMIIKANNGVIADYTVDACANGDIELAPEFPWDESGSSCHLLIEGNVIRDTNFVYTDQSDWPEAGALGILADTDARAKSFNHDDIAVINNRFVDDNGINLLVTDATNMLIAGNIFSKAMCLPDNRGAKIGYGASSLVWLQQCKNILLAGNRVVAPGSAMKVLVGVGPGVSN
ncbi:MAG: hypothetical protein ACP5I8_16390, partial [Phycisphaerae bacterium]